MTSIRISLPNERFRLIYKKHHLTLDAESPRHILRVFDGCFQRYKYFDIPSESMSGLLPIYILPFFTPW